jgi:taurine dioxygenase
MESARSGALVRITTRCAVLLLEYKKMAKNPIENSLKVVRLGPVLGAEITGVDLRHALDTAAVATIHDALARHEILIFRQQDIDARQHIAFGRNFGELTIHPYSPGPEGMPELVILQSSEGAPQSQYADIWHSDETFREEPAMGSILRAIAVPELGGDTLFASMTAAYDGLSDRWQTFISDLEAIHDIKPFRSMFPDTEAGRQSLRDMERLNPKPTHPVVRVHPVTGRKVLFVNPQFTIAIKGMKESESRMVLDFLCRQAEQPEYQYRVRWEPGMMVFWDNRSVQHYAAYDYYPQYRRMERVTIKGDKPFGLFSRDENPSRRGL